MEILVSQFMIPLCVLRNSHESGLSLCTLKWPFISLLHAVCFIYLLFFFLKIRITLQVHIQPY